MRTRAIQGFNSYIFILQTGSKIHVSLEMPLYGDRGTKNYLPTKRELVYMLSRMNKQWS